MISQKMKENVCSDSTEKVYSMILKEEQNRFNLENIGLIQIVDEVNRLRMLWKSAEESKAKLKLNISNLERQLSEALKKSEILHMDLTDTRKNLAIVMEENNALKLDLNAYESRERLLKDAVNNGVFDSLKKEERDRFAFLRDPLVRTYSTRVQQKYPQLAHETQDLDDSEVDYDVTGDSLDDDGHRNTTRRSQAMRKSRSESSPSANRNAHNSKRSRSWVRTIETLQEEEGTPPKRSKEDEKEFNGTPTTTTTSDVKSSVYRKLSRRSLSCGSVLPTTPQESYRTPGLARSVLDIRSAKRPVWTSGNSNDIALRQHTFEEVGLNLKIIKCDECQSALFTTKSLRCKDCHQCVHKQCSSRLRVPCIPRQKVVATPKSANRNQRREFRLQDFCTNSKPMLPYPVVHCVVSLEKRYLTQEGIYRVPGSSRMVTVLLGELRTSRTVPNLDIQETDVITETLKRFLRELKDPLVPRSSRNEFIEAANTFATDRRSGILALNRAICELPQCNRDTMAYLFLHWRKVISVSDFNKMPRENMSRVLAPCVMGLPQNRYDQGSVSVDIANCEKTMNALFSFDDGYWERFLVSQNDANKTSNNIDGNEKHPMLDKSILGPVTTSPATPLISRAMGNRRGPLLGPMIE